MVIVGEVVNWAGCWVVTFVLGIQRQPEERGKRVSNRASRQVCRWASRGDGVCVTCWLANSSLYFAGMR